MSSQYACYTFVNTSLQMTKGKVAAQCMHAMRMACSQLSFRSQETRDIWEKWAMDGAKTITLKADNEDEMMMLLSEYPGVEVRDHGLTQVPANSFTVAMLFPMRARPKGFEHDGKKYNLY